MEAAVTTLVTFLVSQEDLKIPIFIVAALFGQMYFLKLFFIDPKNKKK
jgi:hypothetical protein